jgi:glutamyl-tRNA synthetase
VVDPEGRRLAKRSGDLALGALRESGVDPRALVAWVARSAGQPVEGRVHARELSARFDLALVPKTPIVFGPRERAELFASSR